MDRCTGSRDVTEVLLKTALNTKQSINLISLPSLQMLPMYLNSFEFWSLFSMYQNSLEFLSLLPMYLNSLESPSLFNMNLNSLE